MADNNDISVKRVTPNADGDSHSGSKDKPSKEKPDGKSDDKNNKDNENNKPNVDDDDKDNKSDEKNKDSLKSAFKKGAAMVPVAAAAGVGAHMFYMMKAFLMGIAQMALAAVHAVAGFVSGIVSSVVGFISGVANAIGVTFATAAALVGGASTVGIVSIIMVGVVLVGQSSAVRDDVYIQNLKTACSTDVQDAVDSLDVTQQQLTNAKKVYSALRQYGMPDVNIAAVIGNFYAESSLDSTKIEGCYDENYTIGTEKRKILSDMDNWCQRIFATYERDGVNFNRNGYSHDGHYYCGIGMVQWTGGGAVKIMNVAKGLNCDWYDFDFQMAYIIANPAPTGNSAFATSVTDWKEPALSSDEAADFFAAKYEGQGGGSVTGTINNRSQRRTATAYYYNLITTDWSLTEMQSLGNKITGFISKISDKLYEAAMSLAGMNCEKLDIVDDIGSGVLGYPTKSREISAGYPTYSNGSPHTGVDFPVPSGTDVYAAADGVVVVSVDKEVSYGHYIVIQHTMADGSTLYTLYAHNTTRLVQVGERVSRGQVIAKSGSTGNSTGPHCHFSVFTDWSSRRTVNPLDYLAESA